MPRIIFTQCDYGDEFDVYGFTAMTEEDFQKSLEATKRDLKNQKWPMERYFGTNQSITFESEEEFLGEIEKDAKQITDEEFAVLRKLFGNKYSNIVQYGVNFFLT